MYRDNTGYDQEGHGSQWTVVPGGKMRYNLIQIKYFFVVVYKS